MEMGVLIIWRVPGEIQSHSQSVDMKTSPCSPCSCLIPVGHIVHLSDRKFWTWASASAPMMPIAVAPSKIRVHKPYQGISADVIGIRQTSSCLWRSLTWYVDGIPTKRYTAPGICSTPLLLKIFTLGSAPFLPRIGVSANGSSPFSSFTNTAISGISEPLTRKRLHRSAEPFVARRPIQEAVPSTVLIRYLREMLSFVVSDFNCLGNASNAYRTASCTLWPRVQSGSSIEGMRRSRSPKLSSLSESRTWERRTATAKKALRLWRSL